jgi:hypothetical protein
MGVSSGRGDDAQSCAGACGTTSLRAAHHCDATVPSYPCARAHARMRAHPRSSSLCYSLRACLIGCPGFSISYDTFVSLFRLNISNPQTEELWRCWDTDENGVTDGLEILSGLTLISVG